VGQCYEVDQEKGISGFILKLPKSYCFKRKGQFAWNYKKDFVGDCYEMSKGPTGEDISQKVGKEKCRPETTLFLWVSEGYLKGRCYEVDPNLKGKGYSKSVNKKKCRPFSFLTKWIKIRPKSKGSCYEIDRETKGFNMQHFVTGPNRDMKATKITLVKGWAWGRGWDVTIISYIAETDYSSLLHLLIECP